LAYLRINQLKNAEKYLLKAFQIDKNDSTTHYYIGLLLFAKKKYNQAIPYFEMAIALQKPKTDAENYQLGLIYKEKKKFKKAIAYFSKAYQNNPKHYKAYFEKVLLTDVYYKNSKKSINLYQKYLKLFEKKEKFKTYHAKKRIKEIETEMFFNKKE
jgi:tetratricopeptide (TPR) repeat protein